MRVDRLQSPLAADTGAGEILLFLRAVCRFAGVPSPPRPPRAEHSQDCTAAGLRSKGWWAAGGNGLRHTIGSRHPRRQILDPDQSMKWVGLTGNWSVDQNPTD